MQQVRAALRHQNEFIQHRIFYAVTYLQIAMSDSRQPVIIQRQGMVIGLVAGQKEPDISPKLSGIHVQGATG